MSERVWAWHGGDLYWSTSTLNFTGVVFRGVYHWRTWLDQTDPARPVRRWERVWDSVGPGMQAPDQASRYQVAIAGAAWAGRGSGEMREQYVLRGSLNEVRAKLVAALERRQRDYQRRPIFPTVAQLDWRRDGPWFSPFHRVTDE